MQTIKLDLLKKIWWNEKSDGLELFDAVLRRRDTGEVRVLRCCECLHYTEFDDSEWADCITLEEYVVEHIAEAKSYTNIVDDENKVHYTPGS